MGIYISDHMYYYQFFSFNSWNLKSYSDTHLDHTIVASEMSCGKDMQAYQCWLEPYKLTIHSNPGLPSYKKTLPSYYKLSQ